MLTINFLKLLEVKRIMEQKSACSERERVWPTLHRMLMKANIVHLT